jgi:formate hydrogenlyase transcriptional activator
LHAISSKLALEHVIERGVTLSQEGRLDLGNWLPRPAIDMPEQGFKTLEACEREHILDALESTGWRVSGPKGAAKLLGLNATTLEARMRKLGITRSTSSSNWRS